MMTAIRAIQFITCICALLRMATAEDAIDESKAIEKIKLLGGRIETDNSQPVPHIVKIDFGQKPASQQSKFGEKYFHLLEAFPHLTTLVLTNTPTTDDGLRKIARLTWLKALYLGGTRITDEGLLELKELKGLKTLDLWSEGEAEQKRMPADFRRLNSVKGNPPLWTQKGIKQLKTHLPDLEIRQPSVGVAQPDQIKFGTVGVGAITEGSVRVLFRDCDITKLATKVSSPDGSRIIRNTTGKHNFGQLGMFVYCDVAVSLDTSRAGELKGVLTVAVGDNEVEVPISADVCDHFAQVSTHVLVVSMPYTGFSADNASVFDAWRKLVTSANLQPQYLEVEHDKPVLRDIDLSHLDVILLGCEGLFFAKEEDFKKLTKFAESGGRVIIAANHFFQQTVPKANQFLVPFGLTMKDVEAQNLVQCKKTQIARHPLTEGLETLKFHRPSPVALDDLTRGTILVEGNEFPGHGLVAVAKVDQGEVVALGVSLWWNWIASPMESGADNSRLLQNLLTKPRSHE